MLRLALPLTALMACICMFALRREVLGGEAVHASSATPAAAVPACTPDQMSLGSDEENGNFDGMSHSGTLLVLRNLGSKACRITTVPLITLYNKSGPIPVKFAPVTPAGRNTSVIVAANAELTSNLRWVSGDVYDPSMCYDLTSLHVQVAGKDLGTDIDNHLCGQKGQPITAEMTLLATDPVYRPRSPIGPGS